MSTTTITETKPEVALPAAARAHAQAASPAEPAVPESEKSAPGIFQRYKKPLLIIGGIIAAVAILFYSYDSFTHEETDDAYVTGHLHNVSTRINAVVTDVLVNDNQFVHQGDVLVKLDPSEYVALVAAAQANLTKAEADLKRELPLLDMHAVSPEQIDADRSTRDVDLAQLALAQLQVQYSTIVAPADGYVGRKNVEIGNRVSSGQTLMVVVEPDVWVVANFKETQLAKMKIGQPVKITVDSIPDKVFRGPCRQLLARHGQRIRAASRGQLDRQFYEDRPARAGEDRLRSRLD